MKRVISILLAFVLCVVGVQYFVFAADDTQPEMENITVTSGGKVLTKDVDYYLTYQDNVEVGTATVEIYFINNYEGLRKQTFRIVKNNKGTGGGGHASAPSTPSTPIARPEPTQEPIAVQHPNEDGEKHIAYIVGYDGLFYPDVHLTRAEAAAIFARLISADKQEEIAGQATFTDIKQAEWCASYIGYLEKYNIIQGYEDGTFMADENITRAEFIVLCTRFYELYESVVTSDSNIFSDVANSHWAAADICNAVAMGWIQGYADGTFKPDTSITRAEAVKLVNRATNRKADKEYIDENMKNLTQFADMDHGFWAYYDILEAANDHVANGDSETEIWLQ